MSIGMIFILFIAFVCLLCFLETIVQGILKHREKMAEIKNRKDQ